METVIEYYIHYLKMSEKSNETVKGYRKELLKANVFFYRRFEKSPQVEEITLIDLEDYLHSQLIDGLAQATRSRSYYILRSFYNYCYKKEFVKRNIALNLEPIKVKKKERQYLKQKEVLSLVEELEPEIIKYAVKTIFYTGLRVTECTSLKLKNVDLKKNVIHVIAGKGNKDRDIPISKKLLPVLINYENEIRPNVNSEYFFATQKTGRLSQQYINKALRGATKRLGWDKSISAHVLRHSFASRLVKKEVSLVKIQKLLGHSDLRVTSIYTHTNYDELKKAVNKM